MISAKIRKVGECALLEEVVLKYKKCSFYIEGIGGF